MHASCYQGVLSMKVYFQRDLEGNVLEVEGHFSMVQMSYREN